MNKIELTLARTALAAAASHGLGFSGYLRAQLILGLVVGSAAGIGLAIGRVPAAGALTAVVFLLCIAQLGPLLVMGPATVWLFVNASTGRAVLVLVFTIAAVTLDNFVRPVLIKKGADLPLLLILSGVFGGLLAFGIVGLFVGPVTLAVAWTLVSSWVAEGERSEEAGPAAAP